jgi:hypothetical protein
LEAAKRHAELHGSLAPIVEVRTNVDIAIGVARDRLRLIRSAGIPAPGILPASPTSAFLAEASFLADEIAELRRLRDHLKSLMGAVGR